MEESKPNIKQVMLRASDEEHERWKLAAERAGTSMSEFIRSAVNSATAEIIDCQHPTAMRKSYPWSEICLKCGARLRG